MYYTFSVTIEKLLPHALNCAKIDLVCLGKRLSFSDIMLIKDFIAFETTNWCNYFWAFVIDNRSYIGWNNVLNVWTKASELPADMSTKGILSTSRIFLHLCALMASETANWRNSFWAFAQWSPEYLNKSIGSSSGRVWEWDLPSRFDCWA